MGLCPGGTISYENRNFGGRVGTLGASVNTKNFLAPSDDLSFRVTYTQVGGRGRLAGRAGWGRALG